jgi:hypothetical protein
MISKRTLEKWRSEVLQPFEHHLYDGLGVDGLINAHLKLKKMVKMLTQELLDHQLLNKKEN